MSRRNFLFLFLVFLVFLAIRLPTINSHRSSLHDFMGFEIAHKISSDPMAGWEPESDNHRRHPLFYYFLFLEKSIFGSWMKGYFIVNFLVHFLNAFLVMRLAEKMNATARASLAAGLFFLCTSSFYGVLIMPTDIMQLSGLLLFLLAVLAWIDFIQSAGPFWKAFLFQTLCFFTYEVSMCFPLLAAFLLWNLVGDHGKRTRILTCFVLPLLIFDFLFSVFFLKTFFASSAATQQKFAPLTVSFILFKLASLARMLLVPILIWDKGFLTGPFFERSLIRLIPAILFLGGFFLLGLKIKGEESFLKIIPRSLGILGLGWILITILPHLPHPLGFQHAPRYLLLPAAGFSLIFGAAFSRIFEILKKHHSKIGPAFCVLFLIYVLALNLSSTAYQYQRYQKYLEENPQLDYTPRVQGMFH